MGTPPQLQEMWTGMFCTLVPAPVVYTHSKLGLTAMVGREPVGVHKEALEDLRWHISMRAQDRIPKWEELVEAAHQLRPGVVFCVPLPPRTWWINVHEHVLHLWEIRDTNLENQWRSEHQATGGDRPT